MIHLLWAIHNHQPVGNFDFIFERAFVRAYKPFLDVVAAHPRVRISLHFSGILLDWLEAKRPEYLKELRTLVDRGQVEILGGGFYEPILPVLSDAHKSGQLGKLQSAVKRLFGVTPRGMWLAERVWEPTLVKPIADAGLEYVILDGSHFKMAGKLEADMDGYFLTEDQGATLKLFPIHDEIRDFIPFRPVEQVVEALLKLDSADVSSGGDVQVVFGDDGEKFGDWPHTYDTVYTDRWLHRFFDAIDGMPERIRVQPLEAGLRPEKNLGLVYLPPASYQEMMVWAQDARDITLYRKAQATLTREGGADAAKFMRGTFWRNFLNKYPESNQMHMQGLRLTGILEKLDGTLPAAVRHEALDHIWQSQCNCAYWHGVFGGLYLPHLRFALYRHLIAAQRALDPVLFQDGGEVGWEIQDWNCDGKPEFSLNTPEVYLSFTHAGEINQFWLKRTGINLCDTLTRRFEAYHEFVGAKGDGGPKLENQLGEKEANLRDYLVYDQRTRHSFSDLYLEGGTGFKEYLKQKFLPAFDFLPQEAALERRSGETVVRFFGAASSSAGTAPGFRVEKSFILEKGTTNLRVEWRFQSESQTPVAFRFASETLFCLLAGNAPDRYLVWEGDPLRPGSAGRDILASRGEMFGPTPTALRAAAPGTAAPGAAAPGTAATKAASAKGSTGKSGATQAGGLTSNTAVTVTDEWLGLKCEARFFGAGRVWRDAIETVSQSEGGYERVYQGTVLVPVWDLRLLPGGEAAAALSIQIREEA